MPAASRKKAARDKTWLRRCSGRGSSKEFLSFVTMSKPRENLDTDTSADINIPLRATSPRLPAQTRFSFASAQMTSPGAPLSIDGPGRFC
jgi:hypothetical protein